MPVIYANREIENRAFDVLGLLAQRGQHRAPSIADLILAATAELNNFTILHVDKDFELIQAVTGQPTERLRPASEASPT
jgi:predicted nucleic acid-binding protein